MRTWISLSAVSLIGFFSTSDAANLRGKVTNAAGKPVANAVVTLTPRGMADTTGSDGSYSFAQVTGLASPDRSFAQARLDNGVLVIPVNGSIPVKVEVFDTKGHLLKSDFLLGAPEGIYRWDIGGTVKGANLLVIKVSIGENVLLFRHAMLNRTSTGSLARIQGGLFRSAAISDTLKVVADGYATRRIPIPTLDTIVDVMLDTALAFGHPLKNRPHPSSGCGKTTTLKSGVLKMTSAGLNREYILSIPDNYSSSKPSRLVYGMHWMNGSADAVQGWSKWFGLKALDTERSTIFVAPQGYTNASPWRGDDKDHVFFNELNASLASNLCIDTTRVFSVGFSFGAMYTNSLAQNHQGVLRGVVVYATADYNIYFPANTGKPLAYMGVHGLKDPTCPIAAGRRSRDRFVKNNACTIPATVPEVRSGGDHATYDYKCPSSQPVRWVTFDGGHTYPPNNNGTWVHGQTWEFISQF